MATEARCPRCDELWCAYASATLEHLQVEKVQEQACKDHPALFRILAKKLESLGAERAAARVKITTHLVLSHSGGSYSELVSAAH